MKFINIETKLRNMLAERWLREHEIPALNGLDKLNNTLKKSPGETTKETVTRKSKPTAIGSTFS